MYVYVTIKTDLEVGTDEVLSVFRHFEKARNSCIDNANLQTVNTDLWCDVIDDNEDEHFSIGVYYPEDEDYEDNDPGLKMFYTVTRREVIN